MQQPLVSNESYEFLSLPGNNLISRYNAKLIEVVHADWKWLANVFEFKCINILGIHYLKLEIIPSSMIFFA